LLGLSHRPTTAELPNKTLCRLHTCANDWLLQASSDSGVTCEMSWTLGKYERYSKYKVHAYRISVQYKDRRASQTFRFNIFNNSGFYGVISLIARKLQTSTPESS